MIFYRSTRSNYGYLTIDVLIFTIIDIFYIQKHDNNGPVTVLADITSFVLSSTPYNELKHWVETKTSWKHAVVRYFLMLALISTNLKLKSIISHHFCFFSGVCTWESVRSISLACNYLVTLHYKISRLYYG